MDLLSAVSGHPKHLVLLGFTSHRVQGRIVKTKQKVALMTNH